MFTALICIFALTGYVLIGFLVQTIKHNDVVLIALEKLLQKIFYLLNKEKCYYKYNRLHYDDTVYYFTKKWGNRYQPFLDLLLGMQILFWPIHLIICLIYRKLKS